MQQDVEDRIVVFLNQDLICSVDEFYYIFLQLVSYYYQSENFDDDEYFQVENQCKIFFFCYFCYNDYYGIMLLMSVSYKKIFNIVLIIQNIY